MVSTARAVVTRPDLWWTALGALRRLAAPGWWSSRPYLPRPDGRLWAFRMVTAYGRPDHVPEQSDVIAYLEWCRSTVRVVDRWPACVRPTADGDRRDHPGSG